MKIVKDFSNSLLKRREIEIVLDSESNPNFNEMKKKIVGKFEVPEERVVVKKIDGCFGRREFIVDVFIYYDEASKKAIEPKKKEKKKARGSE